MYETSSSDSIAFIIVTFRLGYTIPANSLSVLSSEVDGNPDFIWCPQLQSHFNKWTRLMCTCMEEPLPGKMIMASVRDTIPLNRNIFRLNFSINLQLMLLLEIICALTQLQFDVFFYKSRLVSLFTAF